MENGSTANKRRSLTLSSRLLQKRHSASPKNQSVRASATQEAGKDAVEPGSPTTNIAEYVESTPPNKMTYSLDDSLDYSPRHNLSPSCLFSQTLTNGSPEVSWRWNRDKKVRGDKVNTTNDSGFDSEEFGTAAHRQHKDQRRQVRADAVNEHRRKQLDKQHRRAQQLRDHELLRERCDKLHRQLDQQAAAEELDAAATVFPAVPSAARTDTSAPAPKTPPIAATVHNLQPAVADAALADFLNDSVTDCFLLEATQELEPKLPPEKAPIEATTPTSYHKKQQKKEKRSSFYMKFLEDESESEDWFVALDEAMLEASQPKKPRTSLQRYKSMPSNTAVDATIGPNVSTYTTCPISSPSTSKADTPRIKRHASSHVLSPATSNARGNLFGKRK